MTSIHQTHAPSHALSFRLATLALGVASVVTVVGNISATNLSMQALALLPVLALALLTNTHPGRAQGRQQVYYALVPVAAAIVTATLVVGHAAFDGNLAWFVAGGLLSAVPFAVAAGLRSAPVRAKS